MKKQIKKSLSLLLAVVMLLTAAPLAGVADLDLSGVADWFSTTAKAATTYTEGYLKYIVENGEAEIVDCDESISGEFVIPDMLGGYPVTKIGDYAFKGCAELTSITIPGKVTKIGSHVFEDCANLTSLSVDLENKVYHSKNNCIIKTKEKELVLGCKTSEIPFDGSVEVIDSCAFFKCNGLSEMEIPDSVNIIRDSAFSCCTNLKSVTIGRNVTYIGLYAFDYCNSLNSLDVDLENKVYHSENNCIIKTKEKELVFGCKTSIIPSDGSVTSIGVGAFSGCDGLTSIAIPDSIISIDNWAFSGCAGLENVIIPKSVTNISFGAFSYCSGITNLMVESGNKIYYSKNNCIINEEENELILGCKTSVIPSDKSITSIGGGAFWGSIDLKSVIIPDSVTSIGNYAFDSCSGLTGVVIPNSIISIGDYAFKNCVSLTNAVLSNSLNSIGDMAFYDCMGLKNIALPDSVKSIGRYALGYYDGFKKITNFTICGCAGTVAETYAKENGFGFSKHMHSYTETVKEATCTEEGLKTFVCSCGKTYSEKIPATGHVFLNWKIKRNATCISSGYEVSSCKSCGKSNFFRIIPATGHTEEHIKGKVATCTESGLTEGKKCSVCGVVLEEQKEIPALGHDIVVDVEAKDPTCTESGTTEGVHCTRCDYKVEAEVLPALKHDIVVDVEAKKPTCTESGTTEGVHCTRCDYKVEAEVLPALKHDIVVDVEAKDPTCTESGTTEGVHCTRCDYNVEAKKIEPLGHTDEDNDGKCDTCGESLGTTPEEPENPSAFCSCACHKKGIVKFFFKIGLFFQKIFKKNKICKCGVYHY